MAEGLSLAAAYHRGAYVRLRELLVLGGQAHHAYVLLRLGASRLPGRRSGAAAAPQLRPAARESRRLGRPGSSEPRMARARPPPAHHQHTYTPASAGAATGMAWHGMAPPPCQLPACLPPPSLPLAAQDGGGFTPFWLHGGSPWQLLALMQTAGPLWMLLLTCPLHRHTLLLWSCLALPALAALPVSLAAPCTQRGPCPGLCRQHCIAHPSQLYRVLPPCAACADPPSPLAPASSLAFSHAEHAAASRATTRTGWPLTSATPILPSCRRCGAAPRCAASSCRPPARCARWASCSRLPTTPSECQAPELKLALPSPIGAALFVLPAAIFFARRRCR